MFWCLLGLVCNLFVFWGDVYELFVVLVVCVLLRVGLIVIYGCGLYCIALLIMLLGVLLCGL